MSRIEASTVRCESCGVVSIAFTPAVAVAYTTSTGSTLNLAGVQYSENMVTTVSSTMFALVMSVAVHSMKTSRVVGWMREWRELMMGGSESTTSSAS